MGKKDMLDVQEGTTDVPVAVEQTEEQTEREMSTEEYLNQRVPVQLIKDNDKYKYDVELGINGYKYIIKRGVLVMVPRKVAMILENTYSQQMVFANLINESVERGKRV